MNDSDDRPYRKPHRKLPPDAPRYVGKPRRFRPGDQMNEWKLIEYRPGIRAQEGVPRINPKWKCQCSCGVIRWVHAGNLGSGQSKSCGHNALQPSQYADRNLKPINSVFGLGQ